MLRSLVRAIVVVVIVVAALAFFAGYRLANGRLVAPGDRERAVGTAGRTDAPIDTSEARKRGAEAGESIADAGNRAAEVISDVSLTTKIKSKMALDDTVKALDINVTTRDGHVTLSGAVRSAAERDRALALARETAGVKSVIDRLRLP